MILIVWWEPVVNRNTVTKPVPPLLELVFLVFNTSLHWRSLKILLKNIHNSRFFSSIHFQEAFQKSSNGQSGRRWRDCAAWPRQVAVSGARVPPSTSGLPIPGEAQTPGGARRWTPANAKEKAAREVLTNARKTPSLRQSIFRDLRSCFLPFLKRLFFVHLKSFCCLPLNKIGVFVTRR